MNRARPSTPEGHGGLMSRAANRLPDKRGGKVGEIQPGARRKIGVFRARYAARSFGLN